MTDTIPPGVCYLMMKSVERAHTPKTMWEKVKLSRGFAGALAQIDTHLQFWPEALIMKNKQRLTKITQYLIRCRRLAKEARTLFSAHTSFASLSPLSA